MRKTKGSGTQYANYFLFVVLFLFQIILCVLEREREREKSKPKQKVPSTELVNVPVEMEEADP